mgnify:CR=1 FL=1
MSDFKFTDIVQQTYNRKSENRKIKADYAQLLQKLLYSIHSTESITLMVVHTDDVS